MIPLLHLVEAGANVFSGSFIIIVNKTLMSTNALAFTFPTTLSALHFLLTYAGAKLASNSAVDVPHKPLEQSSWKWILAVVFAGVISIAAVNASLMFNSAGFNQMTKLIIIPAIAIIEFFALNKTLSYQAIMAIIVMGAGITIATYSAMETSTIGLCIAALSVVSSAAGQVINRYIQHELDVSSLQLVEVAKPRQGLALLLIGPFLDNALSGKWVHEYQFYEQSAMYLAGSCFLAIIVNISAHFCLNRMSAVSFQVMGYLKTALVLFLSWFILNEIVTVQEIFGIAVALLGMVWFSTST